MISVIITATVILVLVGADQALKFWAIASLQGQPERPFLQLGSLDWMHLRYIENSGAAFSSLSGNRGFLIIFPVIMITACFYVLNRLGKTRRWVWFSLPLIAAGGIGNLIDRIFRGGKVVDYLDFQLCRFAVFNFADICVTVGVLILMFSIIFLEKEEKNAKKAKK
ncbi:MAG: signal peptidase II, partial [Oscillospiraceae bacterium]|nr:signal peptidase II [Oscillospiraceae bacterium]